MKTTRFFAALAALAVFAIVSFTGLTGCSVVSSDYVIQTTSIALSATTLKDKYDAVAEDMKALQASDSVFTEDEWDTLGEVQSAVDLLVAKYEGLTDLTITSVTVDEIEYMYTLAKEAYTKGKAVMDDHWDELTASMQTQLTTLDTNATSIAEKIDELLEDPTTDTVNEALTMISGIATIAIKVLDATGTI